MKFLKQTISFTHFYIDFNDSPVPVELPIVDIVLQQIAACVQDHQAHYFSKLLRKRLEPVPIQVKDGELRESREMLGGDARQLVATKIELFEKRQILEKIRWHILNLIEREIKDAEFFEDH